MQRFYSAVSTGPAVGGGYAILLDGRPVRTPDKALMVVPSESLAQKIAAEWMAQEGQIVPETMPLTQMLTTAIDRAPYRAAVADNALQYLDSDLLCYRADEPAALAQEQERLWGQWLDWFETGFGARLATTTALTHVDQPAAARIAAQARVDAMDIHAFTVFQMGTALTGSAVLGLALAMGALSPEKALECALCEEMFYERIHDLTRHGLDPIEERRRTSLLRDLTAAHDYLTATRS